MGDIKCPTCGEPYEAYHMRHDEVWGLPDGGIYGPIWETEQAEGRNPMKFEGMKEAFEEAGWKFAGKSVLTFVRCPACPKDASPSLDRVAVLADMAALYGDDEDGLESMLEWGG